MAESSAYGMWLIVVINVGLFLFFVLSYLKPKKRQEWRAMGAFSAFTVALFTEMYGFPLTIYILTSTLGSNYPAIDPFSHINGHLWVALAGGSMYVWGLVMLLSWAVMVGGGIIMAKAWGQIHKANGKLVTAGLYRLVRHPQYSGLFLITIGMLIQWPTIITAAMWPILAVMYYRLAKREETQMESMFGADYLGYKERTPMFIPSISRLRIAAEKGG